MSLPDRTLRWVNKRRRRRGLPTIAALPAGYRWGVANCPVSRALSGSDGLTLVRHDRYQEPDRRWRPMPPLVALFTWRFDRGAYPELNEFRIKLDAERQLRARPVKDAGPQPNRPRAVVKGVAGAV